MKKTVMFLIAAATLMACSRDKCPFNYHGLPLTLTTEQMIDSLQARGFAIDSTASDSGRNVVLSNPAERYRVLLAYNGNKIQAMQERHLLSTNDSTSKKWQTLRDAFEQELGAWPDCPMLKDNHKIANFDATDGIISVILENTYTPTLLVRYIPKAK